MEHGKTMYEHCSVHAKNLARAQESCPFPGRITMISLPFNHINWVNALLQQTLCTWAKLLKDYKV